MRIGFWIKHVSSFSGCLRRFISVGNEFVKMGHDFYLITPELKPIHQQIPFVGKVISADEAFEQEWDIFQHYLIVGSMYAIKAERKVLFLGRIGLSLDPDGCPCPMFLPPNPWILAFESRYTLFRALQSEPEHTVLPRAVVLQGGVAENFQDRKLREAEPKINIGFFGRLYGQGTNYVCSAIEKAGLDPEVFKIISFGQGPRRFYMPKSLEFEYAQDPDEDQLVTLYSRIHIFLSLEPSAGWSHCTAEAMACGCACICGHQGTPFAVHGKNAFILQPNNKQHIIGAIKALAKAWPAYSFRTTASRLQNWELSAKNYLNSILDVRGVTFDA